MLRAMTTAYVCINSVDASTRAENQVKLLASSTKLGSTKLTYTYLIKEQTEVKLSSSFNIHAKPVQW